MTNFFFNESEITKTRISLLNSYNSKCTSHGAYLLTIAIGILTLFEIFFRFGFRSNISVLFFSSCLIGLVLFGFLTLMRMVFWARMASTIIWIRPIDAEKVECFIKCFTEKKKANITLLYRLERACVLSIKELHYLTYFLSRRNWKNGLLFLASWIIMSVVTFLMTR